MFSSPLWLWWGCNKSNTTGATGGAGTAYTRPEHLSSPQLLFNLMFLNHCLYFRFFILAIVLSVLLRLPLWYLQTFLESDQLFCFTCGEDKRDYLVFSLLIALYFKLVVGFYFILHYSMLKGHTYCFLKSRI